MRCGVDVQCRAANGQYGTSSQLCLQREATSGPTAVTQANRNYIPRCMTNWQSALSAALRIITFRTAVLSGCRSTLSSPVLPKPGYITQNWVKMVFLWVKTHFGIHIKIYRKSVEEEVLWRKWPILWNSLTSIYLLLNKYAIRLLLDSIIFAALAMCFVLCRSMQWVSVQLVFYLHRVKRTFW
jgi:hypothetical protein